MGLRLDASNVMNVTREYLATMNGLAEPLRSGIHGMNTSTKKGKAREKLLSVDAKQRILCFNSDAVAGPSSLDMVTRDGIFYMVTDTERFLQDCLPEAGFDLFQVAGSGDR